MNHTGAVSLVPGSQCHHAEDSSDFGPWVQLVSASPWARGCIIWLWLHIHHPSGSAALVSAQLACLMWKDKQSHHATGPYTPV